MSTHDRHGNVHRGSGTPQGGQFAPKSNSAPTSGLEPARDPAPFEVQILTEPDPAGGFDLAVEAPTGTHYLRDGRMHREDGPAYEGRDGTEEWYVDGKLHRDPEEGPAIVDVDGHREFWRHGRVISA